jgi:putative membrane protein
MAYLTINWVLSALSLLGVAVFVPGFRVTDYGSAVVACGVVGLLAALLGGVLKHTGGVAALVGWSAIMLVIDLLLFRLSGLLIPGFAMRGFVPAFAGAAALVAVSLLTLRWAQRIRTEFDWEPSPEVEITPVSPAPAQPRSLSAHLS